MNSKNIKKFIKLYHEERDEYFKKFGDFYPPKDLAEFEAQNDEIFKDHLKDETDPVLKTKLYISLLREIKYFAFLIAFEKQDFMLLNNAIFQTSRQNLLENAMSASGTDHSYAFFDLLAAFACNDFDIIQSFLPQDLLLSAGQFYPENGANLVKILYFKQTELEQTAVQRAQKFLSKKLTIWERGVVEFLLAVLGKNASKCSEILQDLCIAYQKFGYPTQNLDKCFAAEIHGLYRFVRCVDNELFLQIKAPKHDCFFTDFEEWQSKNGYPKGEIFYKYPPKLGLVNKILTAKIPKVSLHKPYENDKKLYKDSEKFALNLTENVANL